MSDFNIDQIRDLARCAQGSRSYALSGQKVKLLCGIIEDLWSGKNIRPAGGMTSNQGMNGITLTGGKRARGGGDSKPHPFDMTIGGSASSPTCKFYPGSVNQLIPTNILGLVDFGPGPGTYYAKLSINSSDQQITSCSLTIDTSSPSIQDPVAWGAPGSFEWLVGLIVGTTVGMNTSYAAFKTIGDFSAQFTPVEQYKQPSMTLVPNEIPWTSYYIWQQTGISSL